MLRKFSLAPPLERSESFIQLFVVIHCQSIMQLMCGGLVVFELQRLGRS